MKSIYVILMNLKTNKSFKKYFDTEFERDKFIRKSKYFKNIMILNKGDIYEIIR